MKIIVGLGNPGLKYAETRHNAGFMFVDKLSAYPEITAVGEKLEFHENKKFQALIAETSTKGEKIILVKPMTFMNLSGDSVRAILDYYKSDIDNLIVVSDDIDIPVGYARFRQEGSSGGQKGLQNIVEMLGTDQFQRIRIGVANTKEETEGTTNATSKYDAIDFVLSKFSKRDSVLIDSIISEVIEYIAPYLGGREKIPAHTININKDLV